MWSVRRRHKLWASDEAGEIFVVPAGGFAAKADGILARAEGAALFVGGLNGAVSKAHNTARLPQDSGATD
jgi:hypothetical protein